MQHPDVQQPDLFLLIPTPASEEGGRVFHWRDRRSGEGGWSYSACLGAPIWRWHRRWKRTFVAGRVGDAAWRLRAAG